MLTIGREVAASPADSAIALSFSAHLSLLLRDPKTAASLSHEAVRLGHEHGFLMGAPVAFNHGRVLAQLGQIEEGLSEMLRWQTYAKTAGQDPVFYTSIGIAEAYLAAGHPRQGLEAVSEGLERVQRIGLRMNEVEMRRLKGELLLMIDKSTVVEAARSFGDAIEVARRQGAKSLELRAPTSLARLLTKQGRRNEARTMVAEIYGWFTEGFDTADLKDAKALLDDL